MQRHGNRRGAGELDDAFVDREARVGIDDLRPRLAQGQHGEEHGDLAARHDDDVGGIDLDLAVFLDVADHGLAQLGDAVGGCIAVMAVAQRLDGGLDDMVRRLEVRLADAEVDDVLALGGKRVGAGENFEGTFGAQPGHGSGHLNHGCKLRLMIFIGGVQARFVGGTLW